MINLLPYEHKKELRAARMNTVMARYIAILSVAIILLGGLSGATYVVINQAQVNAESKVTENQTQEAQFAQIKQEADVFRSDLATAKTILDNQINYSGIIYRIADAVPQGVVLDSLTLSPETIGSTIDLSASAKSYSDAIRLKDVFTRETTLFSDVKFSSITGGGSGDEAETSGYPVKVSISVVLQKEVTQ